MQFSGSSALALATRADRESSPIPASPEPLASC